MGKLTAAQRKRVKKSRFGIPSKAPGSGSYPMPDRSHAANALARVSQHGTASEKSQVRAKACRLYPDLPTCKAGSKKPRKATTKGSGRSKGRRTRVRG